MNMSLREEIRTKLGIAAFERLRSLLFCPVYLYRRLKCALTWRQKAGRLLRSADGLQLHLGCSNDRRVGMLNCDVRPTAGADVIMNCTRLKRFRDGSVAAIYSHAFFEHVYRDVRPGFLREVQRVLRKDGVMVTLGLPDFERIARAYVEKAAGTTRPKFDLFEVYRYTHGTPEESMCWLPQLHKSLFDREECVRLWRRAGFRRIVVFNYRYKQETLAINLGVVAFKGGSTRTLTDMLEPFRDIFGDLEADLQDAIVFENQDAFAPAG